MEDVLLNKRGFGGTGGRLSWSALAGADEVNAPRGENPPVVADRTKVGRGFRGGFVALSGTAGGILNWASDSALGRIPFCSENDAALVRLGLVLPK